MVVNAELKFWAFVLTQSRAAPSTNAICVYRQPPSQDPACIGISASGLLQCRLWRLWAFLSRNPVNLEGRIFSALFISLVTFSVSINWNKYEADWYPLALSVSKAELAEILMRTFRWVGNTSLWGLPLEAAVRRGGFEEWQWRTKYQPLKQKNQYSLVF